MDKKSLLVILYTTLLSFSSLYVPQPLLPIFVNDFGVTQSTAALTTTLALMPLAIAPILYGVLLESHSAKKVLFWAVILMSLSHGLVLVIDHFYFLLAIRFFQGCLLPAMLTSLMTYISTSSTSAAVQKYMALYVVFQILGGFLGRFFSGLISFYIGWRFSFFILGGSLLFSAILIHFLIKDIPPKLNKINFQSGMSILKNRTFFNLYGSIFCSFFVFASIMNYLPFRITEIGSGMSTVGIGIMYTGFLMGALVSLNAVPLIRLFKGELNTIRIGQIMIILSLLVFIIPNIQMMFFSMFVLCAGMFLIHSVSSGYLNKLSTTQIGVVNGIYVSSYYSGGTMGSYIPGHIYDHFGWNVYLIFCGFTILIGISFIVWTKILNRSTQPH